MVSYARCAEYRRASKSEPYKHLLQQDHDKLAGVLKQHFGVTLEVKDVTFKGWNWGVTDIQGLLSRGIWNGLPSLTFAQDRIWLFWCPTRPPLNYL